MSYLRSHAYDLFVSYAHGPAPLASYSGDRRDPLSVWTQKFVDDLRSQVDCYLGIKDDARRFDVWMDPELEGNQPLTSNLKSKGERSALLLVVMSHFYLDSKWCGQEVEWFASTLTDCSDKDGRVFVVRAFQTDETRWPAALKDSEGHALPGYYFHPLADSDDYVDPHGWPKPTEADKEYQKQLSRLAKQIVKQLQRLEWLAENRALSESLATVPNSVGRRVFLGYMSDTLTDTRNELRHRLVEAGMTVLPPEAEDPYDETSLRQAMDAYLNRTEAEALVLVADEFPGRWPKGQQGGSVSFQLQKAKECNVPSHLWLKIKSTKTAKTAEYSQYLQTLLTQARDSDLPPVLQHENLETFFSYIQDKLGTKKPLDPGVEQLAVVCSNIASDDPIYKDFQDLIIDTIGETERLCIMPDCNSVNGQIKLKALEEDINRADTVVVVCFDQQWRWANSVLRELKQVSGSAASNKMRLFIIGPQCRERGSLNAQAFKFRTLNGMNVDALSFKNTIKNTIMEEIK